MHHGGVTELIWNPAYVDPTLDSRAVTFENPNGARGAGGTAHDGRKGAPNRVINPGERVVLADITGPGVVRHIWMTFMPGWPQHMRAVWLEVFYDGAPEPSVSAPCLDFFGAPHGRPVAFASALTAMHEGRGFNTWIPMPFRRRVRIELTNSSPRPAVLYFQVDYTLQAELPAELGYLHVSFRRENPTTMGRDFVIATGLRGPGRFLGCNVGVRVIDPGHWYGEGEVKIYRDGDESLPTICGTGLEDYVGSAWGLGAHHAPFGGAPLIVGRPEQPDFIGFYRWHLPDPIMYSTDLRVTIQQLGAMFFRTGQEAEFAVYERTNPPAGEGWIRDVAPGVLAWGIAERVDDYCATAYVYCTESQPVPRLDIAAALADIERRPYEVPLPNEDLSDVVNLGDG